MSAYEIIEGPASGVLFNAHTFLEYLRRSNQRWWDGAKDGFNCPWVFRGHADANWALVPSAARPLAINKLKPLVDKIRCLSATVANVPEHLSLTSGMLEAISLRKAYLLAIADFIDLSVRLGITDFDKSSSLKKEVDAGGFISGPFDPTVEETLPAAFLAQHHGVPTFLLDWTKRPEIAAQFAASDESFPAGTGDVAVFALRFESGRNDYFRSAYGFEPFRWIEDAPSKNRFLAAQHGMFTTHVLMHEFITTGRYRPLEEKLEALVSQEVLLKKIVLKASDVPLLRRLLDREDLSDAHLKPTLDNVARTIMARWSLPE